MDRLVAIVMFGGLALATVIVLLLTIEFIFSVACSYVTYGKHRYSFIRSKIITTGVKYPPSQMLRYITFIITYERKSLVMERERVSSYLNDIKIAHSALLEQFKKDDQANTSPLHYAVIYPRIVQALVDYAKDKPIYVYSNSPAEFSTNLLITASKAKIDRAMISEPELAFILDQFIDFYARFAFTGNVNTSKPFPVPFYAVLLAMSNHKTQDIVIDLICTTNYFSSNLNGFAPAKGLQGRITDDVCV